MSLGRFPAWKTWVSFLEYFGEKFCAKEKQTRGTIMIIVVAIDADLSDATQLALHATSLLLAQSLQPTDLVLLHVIPVPDMPQSRFGRSRFTPTAEQREVAEHALHRARLELLKQGIKVDPCVKTLRKAVLRATFLLFLLQHSMLQCGSSSRF